MSDRGSQLAAKLFFSLFSSCGEYVYYSVVINLAPNSILFLRSISISTTTMPQYWSSFGLTHTGVDIGQNMKENEQRVFDETDEF